MIAAIVAAALLVMGLVAPSSQANPTAAAAKPASFPGGTPQIPGGILTIGETGQVGDQSPMAAASSCTPYTGVDNPHRSSTGFAVSGHGWWNKGTCSNNYAYVTVWLLEYYSDGTWRQKAYNRQKIRTYSSSGQRVTARRDCSNSTYTGWMNLVDVDVVDESDDATRYYRIANVYCRVF
jgi:hypothetical protein